MNNSIYSFLSVSLPPRPCSIIYNRLCSPSFDSIINAYLIEHCGLHPPTSDQVGLVVHSHCDFFGSVAYPAVVDLGLRVNKLGKSSVTYEVAVFEQIADDIRAVGGFTHVFVDKENNRPTTKGMSEKFRAGLEKLLIRETPSL